MLAMSHIKQPGSFPISLHLCYLGCVCVITGRHSRIVVWDGELAGGGGASRPSGATHVPGKLGVFWDQCRWLGKVNRSKVNPPHSGCSLHRGLSQNSRNGQGCQCQLLTLSSNFKWAVWAEREEVQTLLSEQGRNAPLPQPLTILTSSHGSLSCSCWRPHK